LKGTGLQTADAILILPERERERDVVVKIDEHDPKFHLLLLFPIGDYNVSDKDYALEANEFSFRHEILRRHSVLTQIRPHNEND
jgi:hypothetical protein